MYRQDADKLGHEPPSGKISPKCVSYKTPDLCRLFASNQMYEKRNRWRLNLSRCSPCVEVMDFVFVHYLIVVVIRFHGFLYCISDCKVRISTDKL